MRGHSAGLAGDSAYAFATLTILPRASRHGPGTSSSPLPLFPESPRVPSSPRRAHRALPAAARRPHDRVHGGADRRRAGRDLAGRPAGQRCAGGLRAGLSVRRHGDERLLGRAGRRRRRLHGPRAGRRPARGRAGAGDPRAGAGARLRRALRPVRVDGVAAPLPHDGRRRRGAARGTRLRRPMVQLRGAGVGDQLRVGHPAGRGQPGPSGAVRRRGLGGLRAVGGIAGARHRRLAGLGPRGRRGGRHRGLRRVARFVGARDLGRAAGLRALAGRAWPAAPPVRGDHGRRPRFVGRHRGRRHRHDGADRPGRPLRHVGARGVRHRLAARESDGRDFLRHRNRHADPDRRCRRRQWLDTGAPCRLDRQPVRSRGDRHAGRRHRTPAGAVVASVHERSRDDRRLRRLSHAGSPVLHPLRSRPDAPLRQPGRRPHGCAGRGRAGAPGRHCRRGVARDRARAGARCALLGDGDRARRLRHREWAACCC